MENNLERTVESNFVELIGQVVSELQFSHKTYGEAFYEMIVGVDRKSGYTDNVKVIVSERLLWEHNIKMGSVVYIHGQIRTYNEEKDGRSHLVIVVFVRELEEVDRDEYHKNNVELVGFVCKPPIRRTSPLGREICDLMVAVNRMYNKSDYIPCIAWGRNATYAGILEVGYKINIVGRVQSREYKKKNECGEITMKTAYEVSILKIDAD